MHNSIHSPFFNRAPQEFKILQNSQQRLSCLQTNTSINVYSLFEWEMASSSSKEYICVPFFAIFSYNSGCMCIWVVRSAFVRQPAQSMSPTPFCRSQIITLKQSADLYTLLTGMVWPSKNKQFTTILWGINQIFHAIFQKYLILHGGKYKLFCKLILNAIEKFGSYKYTPCTPC